MLKIEKIESNFPLLKVDNLVVDNHTVIIGPSGAGKTTFLRCLAGVHPYKGSISINNEVINNKNGIERKVSIAWQDSRLLPNYTMKENVELGGDMSFFDELVSLMQISQKVDKLPHQLSGGEIQRVNILRAVCSKSKLVLLDEPMQGIDPEVVRRIYKTILDKLKNSDRMVLSVTHDLNQIYALFDKAIVIKDGEVIAFDELKSLYENPISSWLASFFGSYIVLNEEDLRAFNLQEPCMVRSEWFRIRNSPYEKLNNAVVNEIKWCGSNNRVSLELDITKKIIDVEVYSDIDFKEGERVYVDFKKCSRPDWIVNK